MSTRTKHKKQRLTERQFLNGELVAVLEEMWTIDKMLRRVVDLDNMGIHYQFRYTGDRHELDIFL